jgi:hypothetical protein
MHNVGKQNLDFNSGTTNNSNTSNTIYTSNEAVATSISSPIRNDHSTTIEEVDLSINSETNNHCQDRFMDEDGNYDYNSLYEIMEKDVERDSKGKRTGERNYESPEDVIEGLNKMNELYKDFDGFKYYNQLLYDEAYGNSTLEQSGCCPTCLAMILTYLTCEDVLPTDLTDKSAKYLYSNGTDVTGNYFYDLCSDFDVKPTRLQNWWDPDTITDTLESGKPIILNVGAGNFTSSGHYIVLLGFDDNGDVIVADPNSVYNSTKTYSLDSLIAQTYNTASACWCFE